MPLAAGLLALAVLCLLPGLLVVRAPWTSVPALSLAFWALSAWWPWLAGPGRGRLVPAALLAFGLLALLRLVPKHEVPPPPGWSPPPPPLPPRRPGRPTPPLAGGPSLVAVAVGLALLAPLPLWEHAPGARLAFQTTAARLIVWHDGPPENAEPLLPLAPFGAHAPALATLAADVTQLSGLDPARSVLAVVVAAAALVLVGLFALHATRVTPWPAVLGSIVGLAASPWPAALAAWGEGEALLALAFLLPAAALLAGHSSRSSAVAAALLLAAGALAQPVLASAVTLVVVAGEGVLRRGRTGRAALSFALAILLAAPGLWPLARALAPGEAASIVLSVRPPELSSAVLGLALAAAAPYALLRLGEVRSITGSRARLVLAAVGAGLLLARVHGWVASGQLPVPAREALARAAAGSDPLQVVCAPDALRDWVPALAARPVGEPGPWIPAVYAREWAARIRRPCGAQLEDFLPSPVTSFDGAGGNRAAPPAYYE